MDYKKQEKHYRTISIVGAIDRMSSIPQSLWGTKD